MAAASREARLVLRLVDGVTRPAKAVVKSINTVNRAIGSVTGGRALQSYAATGRVASRRLRSTTYDTAIISGAAMYGAGQAARNVYDYEKMGNAAQAVGLWTDAQREALEKYAKELNRDFPFTNKDILSAAFELNRAGQTFAQTMGSLRSTLNVSLAGDLGLQETADIMTNVAQAMRLPIETAEQTAETMKRVGDTLAYAATRSNTDISQMGTVFKYVAPLAAATGMSLEEMAAASMVLANNGIKASNAGTGLRFVLSSILKPSKEALKAFDRLNINIADYVKGAREVSATDVVSQLAIDGIDASGLEEQIGDILNDPAIKKSPAKLVAALSDSIAQELGSEGIIDRETLAQSLTETLTVLGTQVDFRGLIRALRDNPEAEALIPTIFGKRHGVKVMALLAQDLDGALASLENNYAGAADKMSKKRTNGIVGDWMRLVAAIDNLTMTLANAGVLETASEAIIGLTNAVEKLSDTSPQILEFGTYALMAVGAMAPLGFAAAGVTGLLSALAGAIGALLSPAGAAVATIGALAAVFVKNNWEGMKAFGSSFKESFVKSLSPETIERWNRISSAVTDFVTSSDSLKIATETWQNWGATMGEWAAKVVNFIEDIIQAIARLIEKIRSIGDIRLPSIFGGKVDGAALSNNWSGSADTGMANTAGPMNVLGGAERKISGKRASGGPVRRGLTYEINEKGIETVTMGVNGFVGKAGAASSTVNITQHISTSDPLAAAREAARLLERQLGRAHSLAIDGRDAL